MKQAMTSMEIRLAVLLRHFMMTADISPEEFDRLNKTIADEGTEVFNLVFNNLNIKDLSEEVGK